MKKFLFAAVAALAVQSSVQAATICYYPTSCVLSGVSSTDDKVGTATVSVITMACLRAGGEITMLKAVHPQVVAKNISGWNVSPSSVPLRPSADLRDNEALCTYDQLQ